MVRVRVGVRVRVRVSVRDRVRVRARDRARLPSATLTRTFCRVSRTLLTTNRCSPG